MHVKSEQYNRGAKHPAQEWKPDTSGPQVRDALPTTVRFSVFCQLFEKCFFLCDPPFTKLKTTPFNAVAGSLWT